MDWNIFFGYSNPLVEGLACRLGRRKRIDPCPIIKIPADNDVYLEVTLCVAYAKEKF